MSDLVDLAVAGIGTGSTIVAGLWALMRKWIESQEKLQKNFLTHLEQKNGHTERIAERFDNTTKEMSESIVRANEELKSEIRLLRQAHKQLINNR